MPASGRTRQKPSAVIQRRRLRVLGTDISLLESIRRQAEADLGFDLDFEILDFPSCQRKAALHPESYDVYDQCFHNLSIVWFWGALQPIDTGLIKDWDKVNDLTKRGGLNAYSRRGYGDAPADKLHVQPGHSLGPEPSRHIAMLPTVHNFDSFGYDTRVFGDDSQGRESWALLFDPRAKGRVALIDEPAIGLFDAALAAEATGALAFADICKMTVQEIDALFQFLNEKRREGFFRACWSTPQEAGTLFNERKVVIQSMWSPAYNELRDEVTAIRESVPKEGYRAWHGGLSIARHVRGAQLTMAYDYLNWWLSGFPAAVMARQGYYMSVPSAARGGLSEAEWDYWYMGREASADLVGADGKTPVVKSGARRSGGSYSERAGRIAVWNTVMDEHNYISRNWARFVADVNGRSR
jgi:putative spermidine/putrescine transport system substrate-binding protein